MQSNQIRGDYWPGCLYDADDCDAEEIRFPQRGDKAAKEDNRGQQESQEAWALHSQRNGRPSVRVY